MQERHGLFICNWVLTVLPERSLCALGVVLQRKKLTDMQGVIQDALVEQFGMEATWALDTMLRDKATVRTADGTVELVWRSTILEDAQVLTTNSLCLDLHTHVDAVVIVVRIP